MVLKAWHINDYEVYAGETLEEAIAAAMADSGMSRDEVYNGNGYEEGLKTPVHDEDETSQTTVGAILAGMTKPGLVCSFD